MTSSRRHALRLSLEEATNIAFLEKEVTYTSHNLLIRLILFLDPTLTSTAKGNTEMTCLLFTTQVLSCHHNNGHPDCTLHVVITCHCLLQFQKSEKKLQEAKEITKKK